MQANDVEITCSVRVYVTEDHEKVVRAVKNMAQFPNFEVLEDNDLYAVLQAISHDRSTLEPLRRILRSQKTLDVARSYMSHTLNSESFSFNLHKQAAYMGFAVFCSAPTESPLGPISFKIKSSNPQALLDWLATPTVDGVPIDELGKRNFKRKPVRRHNDVAVDEDEFF